MSSFRLWSTCCCSAAAKTGRAVLHLDPSSHYGSAWSTFTLEQFLDWAQQESQPTQHQTSPKPHSYPQCTHDTTPSSQTALHSGTAGLYSNVEIRWQQAELGSSRQYNIDLAAKASIAYMAPTFASSGSSQTHGLLTGQLVYCRPSSAHQGLLTLCLLLECRII